MTNNSILRSTLLRCRGAFWSVALFSFFINLLMLTVPIYMLQIFDRVIITRSIDTLIFLTLIAFSALLILALLEVARSQILIGISKWLDQSLSGAVLDESLGLAASTGASSVEGLRDLLNVRMFLTGPGIFPILDAPWTPTFIIIIFLMNPTLGWLSLLGAILLFLLGVSSEYFVRGRLLRSNECSIHAMREAEAAGRNADVIQAMGMSPSIVNRWHLNNDETLDLQGNASSISSYFTAGSKFWRQGLQLGILGLGAWLVLAGEITPGVMIAASILMARALAPVEQAIASWNSAISARSAYQRLKAVLTKKSPRVCGTELPRPKGNINVENITFVHHGRDDLALKNVSFEIEAGEALGLIGPTAAGKSTLASLLVGIRKPLNGHVRLDGADIENWAPDKVGRFVGYLPQKVELFPTSIKTNIARMGEADDEKLISAAKLADVHEMILSLPDGYETVIGDRNISLSGGQCQRIGLARAVYNQPNFIVLDEPNSSLDAEGEQALIKTIKKLKNLGTTLVIISHRPKVVESVNKILVLKDGIVEMFGTREEVIPNYIPRKKPKVPTVSPRF